jgi:hypothetical protein
MSDQCQVQPGDIVATEHWASSGFPNTDLDHQLRRLGKEKIILLGLLANTCVGLEIFLPKPIECPPQNLLITGTVLWGADNFRFNA